MATPELDVLEMVKRLSKYLIEGLVVAIVAAVLPRSHLSPQQVVLLGLTAASVFSLLDWTVPSVAPSMRQGVGLGLGLSTVGFPL